MTAAVEGGGISLSDDEMVVSGDENDGEMKWESLSMMLWNRASQSACLPLPPWPPIPLEK